MSTSTPNPPSSSDSPPQQQQQTPSDHRQTDYVNFKRYTAYTFLIASPLLIALPPRKLDLHTAALTAAFIFSANHVTHERTGRGITEHIAGYVSGVRAPGVFRELPTERAEEVQRQLRDMKARERADREREREDKDGKIGKVAKEIWMGGETEGWRERRAREEREALDQGLGYWDLIVKHVKDAWGMEDGDEDEDGNEDGGGDEKKKGQ